MKVIIRILAVLIFCGVISFAEAAVTATVNSTAVPSGETVQLQITRDSSADSQPDLAPLKKDFDVLGSSSGSNVQIINGHMSSQTQVTVALSPKHDGQVQIPPIEWGGEQSAAIELTVGGSGANRQGTQAANDNAHLFMTTTLDQKQPFVQAAVVLTLRIYADQPLHQASLEFPASGDVLIKQLGKDTQSNEVRNGRNFQVIERKYLLFPQRSGKINLEGPQLNAQIQDSNSNDPMDSLFQRMPFGGILNTTHPVRLHTKPIELSVLPRPAKSAGTNWIPAQKVTLEETWHPDTNSIHAGEPLTRHLRLSALGLTGGQLPDLTTIMSVPNGIKAYPDQSNVADVPRGNTVLGSRDQDVAIMAGKPGHYELPAIHLEWWDTVNNEKHEVALPAHAIEVLAAPGNVTDTINTPPVNSVAQAQPNLEVNSNAPEPTLKFVNAQIWMWTSFALGVLWLSTILAWWLTSRRKQKSQPAQKVAEKSSANTSVAGGLKEFNRACNENNPQLARQQLIAWANSVWPSDTPTGLNEISRRFDDEKLVKALRELDRACYTRGEWNGKELAKIFCKPVEQNVQPKQNSPLPKLYL